MRVGRPWGREGRTSGTGRAGQVMHDFLGIRQPRKVYQQVETRADGFAAAGLAEIRDRGGNLEWTVQLLFGTQRIVGHGIVAGADKHWLRLPWNFGQAVNDFAHFSVTDSRRR